MPTSVLAATEKEYTEFATRNAAVRLSPVVASVYGDASRGVICTV